MKKAFDQTVRDLKREVNKKVLKVPGIEQKVLDATSNESWGPHGSVLADIALATRNYHEYQMIMSIIWKRINDTGKNWRHVYKALTVLEYLVAHGSERVIDEIKEHSYQISALADFQYIDSSGRDQGSNVRKKSQSLVALVNDKERIIEVREKAAANRDKYRSTSSSGGMYRPGSGGYGDRYDDDRYGNRDDDRYGRNGDSYGREKEWGYRDDDRYGRNGGSHSRDGDRYDDRYGRDGFKDDEYRGRSQSVDDNQYGQRSRSSDRDRERFDDDGQYSSRSGPRADDSQEGRKLDRKFSEQNIVAPPSYEEAVSESRSPGISDRNGEAPSAVGPSSASPPASSAPIPPPPEIVQPANGHNAPVPAPTPEVEVHTFDEFDPRGAFSAAPVNANNAEVDLLGSLALAIVPTTSAPAEPEPSNFASAPSNPVNNQPFGDPFGDNEPFKAFPSELTQAQPQSNDSFHAVPPKVDLGSNFDSLSGITYSTPSFSTVQPPTTNPEFLPQELSTSNQSADILADILPPANTPQPAFSAPVAQPGPPSTFPPGMIAPSQGGPVGQNGGYLQHSVPHMPTGPAPQYNGNFAPQGGPFGAPNNGNFYQQHGALTASMTPQAQVGMPGQLNSGTYLPQQTFVPPPAPQVAYQPPSVNPPVTQPNNDVLGSLLQPSGPTLSTAAKPSKEFSTKSTVWADTLSRGLVNLNISGPKINPLADIGVDFDALNRKEKRLEKPVANPVTSTVTMGKAMGSGSGIGRVGASGLRPPPNHMMGAGMGMGMGTGGPGLSLGGYGGMNHQPMGMGMGMGMNMGMGQGPPMQPTPGFAPGPNVPGAYNTMMGGPGGYAPQQPYGGYR